MKRFVAGSALLTVLLFANLGWTTPQGQTGQETPAPDNTKINKRDQSESTPTADQQKENAADRKMAQQIRKAVSKNKSLSTYAHNVKIIVQGGAVTLRGPVRSAEEKKMIEDEATKVAGQGKVTNEIEVKAKESQ